MSALDDAIAAINASGDSRAANGRIVVALIQHLQQVFANADARMDADEARAATLQTQGSAIASALDSRISVLEAETPFTINVLQNASQLPANAPVTQWFRVKADTNVYVGNGAGNPLTKIATLPLP